MTTSDTNLVLLERLKQLRFIREGSVRPSSSETTFIPKFSSEKFLPANILPVKIKPQPAAYSENFVTRLLSLMEKKRNCSSSNNDVDSSIFIFNPPDWKWQKNKASELDLPIEKIHYDSKAPWHLFTVDTPPKMCQPVSGDGNCFFRSLSFWITGSENYHQNLRTEIVREMLRNAPTYKNLMSNTVEEYIEESSMHQEGVWGTEMEIFVAASLLKTPIMVHGAYGEKHLWQKFKPFRIQPPTTSQLRRYHAEQRSNFSPLPTEATATLYLHNSSNHFEPVIDI